MMIQKKQAETKVEKTKAITEGNLPEGDQSGIGADPSVPMTGQPTPVRTKDLMAQVVSKENMSLAYKRVVSNKGAAGVDGMQVDQLQPYLKVHWEGIKTQLEKGIYYPKPVRKVEIPKPGGAGKRMLGIPTALDRLINQAILQVLSPIWEPLFSENSYGFRPGRSAQDAVKKAQSYQDEGLKIVVDLDLEKFFGAPR
jgi:RNA-directed DNA polymerase